MHYCTQCGTAISSQSKFCPSCGQEITGGNTTKKVSEKPVPEMEKGTTKSLQNKAQDFIDNKTQKKVRESSSPFTEPDKRGSGTMDEPPTTDTPNNLGEQRNINSQPTEGVTGTLKKINLSFWIWIYVALSGAMTFFGRHVREILILTFVSSIITIIVYIRRHNAKPFNMPVKLVLAGQLALIALLEFRWHELMFNSIFALILLILFFVIIILMFKGNKN